jgi:hypothetical protein
MSEDTGGAAHELHRQRGAFVSKGEEVQATVPSSWFYAG